MDFLVVHVMCLSSPCFIEGHDRGLSGPLKNLSVFFEKALVGPVPKNQRRGARTRLRNQRLERKIDQIFSKRLDLREQIGCPPAAPVGTGATADSTIAETGRRGKREKRAGRVRPGRLAPLRGAAEPRSEK